MTTRFVICLAVLSLAACGGSGGGGGVGTDAGDGGIDGGGTDGGGGGGTPQAAKAAFAAPTTGMTALEGDQETVRVVSEDDRDATVRVVADEDGDVNTTADQYTLAGPFVLAARSTHEATVDLSLLPAGTGAYTLALIAENGVGPVAVVALPNPLTIYEGLAAPSAGSANQPTYGTTGDVVAFAVSEQDNGAIARNGDGDATDAVMALLDLNTGNTIETGIAVKADPLAASGEAHVLSADGGVFAWLVAETDQGSINADADMLDTMIAYVAPTAPTTAVLNTLGGVESIDHQSATRILCKIAEVGDGLDQNGDGDILDTVQGALDITSLGSADASQFSFWPSAPSTPVPGGSVAANGRIVFRTDEAAVGPAGTDVNGDFDTTDSFLVVSDMAATAPNAGVSVAVGSSSTQSLGPIAVDVQAAFALSDGGIVGFVGSEVAAGLLGTDLNNDGDNTDFAPLLWDATTEVTTVAALGAATTDSLNSGAAAPAFFFDGSLAFFTAQEDLRSGAVAGSNNDGDNGADLQLLLYIDAATNGAFAKSQLDFSNFSGVTLTGLSLDQGGEASLLTAGRVAVTANEAANGNVDLNGNGQVDTVFLILDTTVSTPLVILPALPGGGGLVPADTLPLGGTLPLTGLSDALGVALQVREQDNGDMNNDGDTTDILVAYVSYENPALATVLDCGADHVSFRGVYVAVLGVEAYTGLDLNNLPGTAGFALRIYRRNGASLELLQSKPAATAAQPTADAAGSVWVYLRSEALEGRDLNQDGDQTDTVLGLTRP